MQIFLAVLLVIVAIVLFLSKIDNEVISRASNVGGVVATVAAVIVLAFYTGVIGSPDPEQVTPTQKINPTSVNPTPAPSHTPAPTITNTPSPTEINTVSSAPIVDSIEFPKTIVCDGRRYDVPIRFHDLDGDAHRVQWEMLYTKKQTPLYSDAVEFFIDNQEQINGATFHDFIQWYIPGDEVKIRVYIEDREKQTGFMDFEFKCSN